MTVALVLMAGAALIGVAGPACLGPTVRPSLLPAAALATWLGALLAFLVLTTLSATLLLFPHVLDTSGVRTLVGGCLSGTVPHSSFGTLVQLGISLLPPHYPGSGRGRGDSEPALRTPSPCPSLLDAAGGVLSLR